MSTATMEQPKAKAPESDELTEQQRAEVQLSMLHDLTMAGHVASKLALGRKRLARTWRGTGQLEGGDEAEGVEDMQQILARDVTFIENHPTPTVTKETEKTVEKSTETTNKPQQGTKWPLWAATMLGLAIPGTAGILMAPWIIEALYPPPAPVQVVEPAPSTEYVPILLPGKPSGAKD